ncbi:MAG: UPF0182 family protein [Gammaproteobacteria bacterium]|nr:UPF0182 family protein [Gammaproteobacteria bacterium]
MLILTIVVVAVVAYLCSATLSYYVDSLWFGALGYASVFWTRFNLRVAVFCAFAVVTFIVLYGAYWALRPEHLGELPGATILVNRQRVILPIEPLLNLGALVVSLAIAAQAGATLSRSWMALVLWRYAPQTSTLDPVFGRPLGFYLFQLPAWELLTGWLTMLAALACAVAAVFVGITAGARALTRQRVVANATRPLRGLAITVAVLLLTVAVQVYFGRFERLFDDHTIFSGVDYTQAHITLAGLLLVCGALLVGAAVSLTAAVWTPRLVWIGGSVVPAIVCYIAVQLVAWYVSTLIVRPNQLERERPYIAHNIELTRQAYDLDRIQARPFPADSGIVAVDPSQNQTTLDNIRLWDWRALQDTLRQIQEIRTYYDFPDIDIDRYQVGGSLREVMLAARELNVQKLPVSSRTWINEKLIYTHGYGVAMTSVNGFTPEGLPELVLQNMPVESSLPGLTVTRPQIYFGELTNTDVYVKTRQREFNYPQGEQNNLASFQGSGGIPLGGLLRRTLIAYERGDVAKLPFSDDVTDDSRLLMRRNIVARVRALAPFLTLDPDPYIVVTSDGKLYWIIDAYTTSDTYPYSRRYFLGDQPFNYIRNSVKVVIDAYTGATTLYVFDSKDPVLGAYRNLFPALFRDKSALPADLLAHVRYPELLLTAQAEVYALYHMTNPEVFYNREDLWQVATEVRTQEEGPQDVEANYVLMTLPGEQTPEFIDILPFTPANRNNLIGWIGGRSDGAHYGEAVVYDFPKSKLVDGPLQVEARIDQNASISGQLTLWNQQGSHVRRGSLIVIPVGKALLYAEPIYLQAANSPMPELRLVVLALQNQLAYGPTFETAMAALFQGAPSTLSAQQATGSAVTAAQATAGRAQAQGPNTALSALIDAAAQDFADYQQLTAAGKLADAGKKLEALKRTLAKLESSRQRQ